MLLLTDRGFAKRVLFMDFEPQARGGKGVKAFYFNKSGSNGSSIADALLVGETTGTVLLTQKKSPPSSLSAADIPSQGKQDKGVPCVMALLDDVVTGVLPLAPAANEPTDDAEETR